MMPSLLIIAVPAVTLALILYSVAIWAERISNHLKPWHVVVLWLGFVMDTLSSVLMARIAGGLSFNLHGFTGVFANTLMLIAAVWATLALRSLGEN